MLVNLNEAALDIFSAESPSRRVIPASVKACSIAVATSASSWARSWSPCWMTVTFAPMVFRRSANSQFDHRDPVAGPSDVHGQ
jgi:hypothetical protein